ncbi:DUF1643 domain-containing protein [Neobacillus drentensis]|uniref:DUF1643 domain-containing protein n=1 Tax=Neobacillus drentensis TaxID=220684 RepID=UPI0030005284
MDFKWIEEENLVEQYNVYGSFYDIDLGSEIIQCRNDLHIYDKSSKKPFNRSNVPQLLMIMMNPGTSKPQNSNFLIPCYNSTDAGSFIRNTKLIKTVPDKTQYQVMRIMWNMGFEHTRVINISDLRNPESMKFSPELNRIHPLDSIHSLFSEKRIEELKEVLYNLDDQSVIFKAWGIGIVDNNKHFKGLAKKCLLSLPSNKKWLGLKGKTNLHYRHPLPFPSWSKKSQENWLKSVAPLFHT